MAILALLFIIVPIAELYVIIQVGQAIGVLNTIALLFLSGAIGGWLMKREGLGVIRRVQEQLQRGQVPGKEIVDGFLILFGGALMLSPGFLSDAFGITLLLPPTRAVIRTVLARRFKVIAINRSGFGGTGGGGFIDV